MEPTALEHLRIPVELAAEVADKGCIRLFARLESLQLLMQHDASSSSLGRIEGEPHRRCINQHSKCHLALAYPTLVRYGEAAVDENIL
jgi:hypothetical protein